MTANEIFNFRKFTDGIDTSGLVSEDQLRALSQQGYVAVVNLLPDEHEYAIKHERELVESQGMQYHYRPVDFAAPSDEDYDWYETTLQALPAGTSLVHCAANYRVSAFSSIYAYRNLGWSRRKASAFVSDVWDPGEHPVWKAFVDKWMPGQDS